MIKVIERIDRGHGLVFRHEERETPDGAENSWLWEYTPKGHSEPKYGMAFGFFPDISGSALWARQAVYVSSVSYLQGMLEGSKEDAPSESTFERWDEP